MSNMKTVLDNIISDGLTTENERALKRANIQSDIKQAQGLKLMVENFTSSLSARGSTLTTTNIDAAISDINAAITALESELTSIG